MNFLLALILTMLFFMAGKFIGGDSFNAGWISFALLSIFSRFYIHLGNSKEREE